MMTEDQKKYVSKAEDALSFLLGTEDWNADEIVSELTNIDDAQIEIREQFNRLLGFDDLAPRAIKFKAIDEAKLIIREVSEMIREIEEEL